MKKLLLIILIFNTILSCNRDDDYKWTTIGDSITYQDQKKYKQGHEKGELCKGYQTIWIDKQDTTVSLNNLGFSGLSLSGKENSVYSKVINKDFSNQDLITIAVGTNDFKLNKPINSRDSLNSFSYTLRNLVKVIKIQNPDAHMYLLTPLKRNKDGYNTTSKNEANLTLNDYREEIIKVSNEFNIGLIDLYEESGIDESNLKDYTHDGLHPNNNGYKLIGELLIKKMKL